MDENLEFHIKVGIYERNLSPAFSCIMETSSSSSSSLLGTYKDIQSKISTARS